MLGLEHRLCSHNSHSVSFYTAGLTKEDYVTLDDLIHNVELFGQMVSPAEVKRLLQNGSYLE